MPKLNENNSQPSNTMNAISNTVSQSLSARKPMGKILLLALAVMTLTGCSAVRQAMRDDDDANRQRAAGFSRANYQPDARPGLNLLVVRF